VSETLGEMNGARILDLYSGGGNFSLKLAVGAKRAVAVEESAHAIDDGERNAAVNRITGMKFLKGTAETARFQGEFDVVLLDPPRPGLTPQAFERVISVAAQRIVYISCNPSTLARDLKKFAELYKLQSIRMVDFFPNTYHVEAVAFMVRKSPLELEAEAQARAEAEAQAKAEAEKAAQKK
jgi:23S rRNA (uracil1939-C5)-methyltransferase